MNLVRTETKCSTSPETSFLGGLSAAFRHCNRVADLLSVPNNALDCAQKTNLMHNCVQALSSGSEPQRNERMKI